MKYTLAVLTSLTLASSLWADAPQLSGGPVPVDPAKPDGKTYPGVFQVQGSVPVGRGSVGAGVVLSPNQIHSVTPQVSVPLTPRSSVQFHATLPSQSLKPVHGGVGFQLRFK